MNLLTLHSEGLPREGHMRLLAVQAWEWTVISEAADGRCETRVLCSRYDAVTVARLMALLDEAGSVPVERRDGVLFQPVLMARRA